MPFDEPISDAAQKINSESGNQPAQLWGGDISEDSNIVLRAQQFSADGLHPMTIVGGNRDQSLPVSNQAVFSDPRLQLAYLLQESQGSSYPFGSASTQVPVIDQNVPPPPVPGDGINVPVDSTVPLPSPQDNGATSAQPDAVQTTIDNLVNANAKGGADINGSGNANSGGGAVDSNNGGSNSGGGNSGGGAVDSNNGGSNSGGGNSGGGANTLRRLLSLGLGIGLMSSLLARGGGLGGGGAMGGLLAFSMIGSLLSRGLGGGGGLMNSGAGYNNPNSIYNGGYNNYNSAYGLSPYGIGNSGLFSIFGRR